MELLKKLIRSLARQLKEVKEAAVGNNIPEAAVIREPVKEYAEEEAAAERRLEEDHGNPDRLHCKRTINNAAKYLQHADLSKFTRFVY